MGIVPGGPPRAIAHRGEPVGHRENTLPALRAALDLRADLVEIDVKVTSDGVVVLLHDDTLDRLWGDPARIDETRRADLDPDIPLLADALTMIAGSGAALMIDMDAGQLAEPALHVVEAAVAAGPLRRDEVVWCGDLAALQRIRALDGAARIVLSWGGAAPPPDAIVTALAPEAYNPDWRVMPADAARWARERRLALCCWTVDAEDDMVAVLDRGADAVISNRIAALRTVIDARHA